MKQPKPKILVVLAIHYGGFSALGRELGISGWAVQKWHRTGVIPPERVPAIVSLAKLKGVDVKPWQIRPDVYPAEMFADVCSTLAPAAA